MTVYSARREADIVMPSSFRPDRRALHAVGCAFVSRLAPRAALTRTAGAAGTAAAVFALEALSSLRPALSGLRFTIQILNLARLSAVLARACGSLARARLRAPLRAIGSAGGSLSALCSLTPRRLRTCIRNRLLLTRIRLRGRRLSTRLPACGGGLSVLRSLILCAVRLGLRTGLRARRIYRVPAAIFILLPTVVGFLINVAVFSGVNVAASALPHEAAPVLSASTNNPPALGCARTSNCTA
jgi:hypothetical protein